MASADDIVPRIDETYRTLALQVMATKFRKSGPVRVVTRSVPQPTACKMSALIYVVICILITQGIMPPLTILRTEDSDRIKEIIDSVKSDYVVGNLINNNKIDPTALRLHDVSVDYLRSKNMFFVVLLNVSEVGKSFDPRHNIGNISHYFVIVQRSGRFFLISSYGSSFCIPQKEVEIDLDEWTEFVDGFTNPDKKIKKKNNKMIAKLREYFLPLSDDVTLLPPDEDDVDYKGDVALAIQADVDFYLEHEHQIVSIDNIDELIIPYIPSEEVSRESNEQTDKLESVSRESNERLSTDKLESVSRESNERLSTESKKSERDSMSENSVGGKSKKKTKTKRKSKKKYTRKFKCAYFV